MKWICVEPHTHTVHSDAPQTVQHLLDAAHAADLDVICLTDHNTFTGFRKVPAGQKEPVVVPGIEWTTFFGHVVVIAPDRFVEWRDLTKSNLDEHLRDLHDANGVDIMAHPYVPGEPFCCGCHWDFEIPDYNQIDGMEVWSEGDPDFASWNLKAYRVWQKKINEGYHITAVTARDWHEDAAPEIVFGVNYMLIDDTRPIADAVKDAIRSGSTYLTAGPTLSFAAETGGMTAGIGDKLKAGSTRITVSLNNKERADVWEPYEIEASHFVIYNSRESIIVPFNGYGKETVISMDTVKGPLYVEVRGTAHGKCCKIALSNPVWVTD